MRGRTPVLGAALLLAISFCAETAGAKRYGASSPGGRRIYTEDEQFESVIDQRKRQFVLEMAVGAGPEGNLGLLLGWLNQPVRGLEYYVGFGLESNPARQYTGSVRYLFNIEGFRPYLALGYLFKDLYVLQTHSHNLFGEVGYSWVLHRTYHLTAGVGVRRILSTHVREGSPLLSEDVDPATLDEELDNIARWVPTVALRFSRAF